MIHDEDAHYLMAPQDVRDHLVQHHDVATVVDRWTRRFGDVPTRAWAGDYLERHGIDVEMRALNDAEVVDLALHEWAHETHVRTYVVTVKLPRNPAHDPRNKITGPCPLNAKRLCTDVTGAHHSFVTHDDRDAVTLAHVLRERGHHVTRIEELEI